MRKRFLVAGIILLLLGAAVTLVVWFPVALYVPVAVVRQESFFGGKPTSYWARALKREPFLGEPTPEGDIGRILRDGGAASASVLRELAASDEDEVRSEALLALSLMGPEAKGAVPALEATVKKEKNSTRFLLASEALGNVDAAVAGAELGAIARDKAEDRGRRAWALTALLKLAPSGREARADLEALMRDRDEDAPLRVEAPH